MSIVERSRGVVLLQRTCKSQAEIAARIGVSRSLVAQWTSCTRPLNKAAHRIALRDAYSIPIEAWDQPASETIPPPATLGTIPPPAEWNPGLVRAQAALFVQAAHRLVERADGDEGLTTMERGRILTSASSALAIAGRLTGEAQDMPEDRILKLPGWRRIEEAIVGTLKPWPDALRAIGETLSRLGDTK